MLTIRPTPDTGVSIWWRQKWAKFTLVLSPAKNYPFPRKLSGVRERNARWCTVKKCWKFLYDLVFSCWHVTQLIVWRKKILLSNANFSECHVGQKLRGFESETLSGQYRSCQARLCQYLHVVSRLAQGHGSFWGRNGEKFSRVNLLSQWMIFYFEQIL